MKILYFDPFNGIAGDMILGALIDLGLPREHLEGELEKLSLEGYVLSAERIERQGLVGTNFQVKLTSGDQSEGHGRHFSEIRELIEDSRLDDHIQQQAVSIFRRLAEAEARVHGSDIEGVHFHEVGAIDAIVDIVGACIGFDYLGIEQFYSSPPVLGFGTVKFSHGQWPVPAPATAELLRDWPSRIGPWEGEMTTPTGAAIITTLAGPASEATFVVEKSGFGAGDREMEDAPNMLRLMLGREAAQEGTREGFSASGETILVLEASIDDLDGETFGHFLNLALSRGALDVFYTPIQMKKSRPGVLLTVLCRPGDEGRLTELIFEETSTLGVRLRKDLRWCLEREERRVEIEVGSIRVKVARLHGRIVNIAPEFEDLQRLADEHGLPLKRVRQMAVRAIAELDR